ncbi:MAG: hypothetical protein HGB12_17790 [Bacteroidetes bacterium]|nr:hypothetical protein [Bacteroidota bacterium]
MHRITSDWYMYKSIDHALKTGDTSYYFHPYEIGKIPDIKKRINFRTKILLRKLGDNYKFSLLKFIDNYKDRFISGKQLLEKHNKKTHI